MNTKLIAALASALVATTALATAASAGGGVRLGFGGPLGTFVATPSHGGGGNAYAKSAAQKRKAAAVREASRKQEPPARIAKVEPRAVAKAPSKTAVATPGESEADEAPRVTGSSALIQGSISAEEPASTATETPAPDVKAEAASEPAVTAAAETCKKFIPALGVAVDVGCDE